MTCCLVGGCVSLAHLFLAQYSRERCFLRQPIYYDAALSTFKFSIIACVLFQGSLLVPKSTSRICGAPDTHEQFQSLPLPTSLTFLIHAVQQCAGHKHRPQWRIRIPLTAGTARIAETRRITTHTGGAQERVACKKAPLAYCM